MAVAGAQTIGVVAPAAAPQRDPFGLGRIGIGAPLPDVAGHVVKAVGRDPGRETPHRGDAGVAVGAVGRAAGDGAEVGRARRPLLWIPIAPGVAAAVAAAGGELPLRLGGQAQAGPAAEGGGVAGADLHHRVVGGLLDGAPGPRGVAPVGALGEPPAPRPDVARAPRFRVGAMAGGGDEGGELGIGDLEAHEPEGRHGDRFRRLVGLAGGVAHDQARARDRHQVELERRREGGGEMGEQDRENESCAHS